MANKKTYSDLLKDPRWQKKRLQILNRDEFTCLLCGDERTELQVHHKKYFGKPWECPNEYLETLCKTCHSIVSHSTISNIQHISKGSKHVVSVSDDNTISLISKDSNDCYKSVLISVDRYDDDIINFAGYITFSDFSRRGLKIVDRKEEPRKIDIKF